MQNSELITNHKGNRAIHENAIVLYHGNCADGSCSAALIAFFKKMDCFNNSTLYIPCAYSKEEIAIQEISNGLISNGIQHVDELYIVDFSFPVDIMQEVYVASGCPDYVVYLDHHKTGKVNLESFRRWLESEHPEAHSVIRCAAESEKKAGATLTYDYIRERHLLAKLNLPKWGKAYASSWVTWCEQRSCSDRINANISELARTCTDYDLWIHANPETMPLVTGLMIDPLPVSDWLNLIFVFDTVRGKYLERGRGLLLQQKTMGRNMANSRNLPVIEYGGHKIAIINVPAQWTNILSDEIICSGSADAVLSYSIHNICESNSKVSVSMRSSSKENAFNCALFMKKWFTGGGHTQAAGGSSNGIVEFIDTVQAIKNC